MGFIERWISVLWKTGNALLNSEIIIDFQGFWVQYEKLMTFFL